MPLAELRRIAASYMPETTARFELVDVEDVEDVEDVDVQDFGLILLLLLQEWWWWWWWLEEVFRRVLRPLCGIGCHYTAM